MRRILPVLFIVSTLCACGQKGALYLPDSRQTVRPAATPMSSPLPAASPQPAAPPAPAAVPPSGAAVPTTDERDENAARNRAR